MEEMHNFQSLRELTESPEMLAYLTIKISRSKLMHSVLEATPVEGPVEIGDYLVASMDSPKTRYQAESAKIHVGTGIWGKAFEDKLPGMILGRNKLTLGEYEIIIEITSIKRIVPANITNTFVKRQLLPGIVDVEGYMDYMINKEVQHQLLPRQKMLTVTALQILSDHSVFEVSPALLEKIYQSNMDGLRYKAERKGVSLDNVLGENEEKREARRKKVMEKSHQLARFYEVTKYLAEQENREFPFSSWGRETMELASDIITAKFQNKFSVVIEA